jgi:hypothetical protein
MSSSVCARSQNVESSVLPLTASLYRLIGTTMPWIQFDSALNYQLTLAEIDLGRLMAAMYVSVERTSTVPGMTQRNVSPDLIAILTERGFPFTTLDLSTESQS